MKNNDVMDLIVIFCILFVFTLVLYCFCVASEFSVNNDLYITLSLSGHFGSLHSSVSTRTGSNEKE